MFIGVVIGNVWATKKDDQLNGMKLMVVQRIDPADGKRHESIVADGKRHESIVAADRVGAGIGEQVLVVTGSSARMALSSPDIPMDAAIVGILDEVEINLTKGL